MSEAEERERVVRLAREWVGLPYIPGARLRGVGGDCTFIALVYEDAGLIAPVPIKPYSLQAHLHRTGSEYINAVRDVAVETSDPRPGDVAMYWFGRDFSHGAIIAERGWPYIIHGDRGARRITEAIGDQAHLSRAAKRLFFTFWSSPYDLVHVRQSEQKSAAGNALADSNVGSGAAAGNRLGTGAPRQQCDLV